MFLVGGLVEWQTFTAGRSGALDRVDLLLNREGSPDTLTVEVHATTAGQPAGEVLGSGTLTDSALDLDPSTFEWASVALGQPATVEAGTQYAIVIYAPVLPPPSAFVWATDTENPYPGGSAGEGGSQSGVPNDHAFRTYVLAASDTNPP